MAAAKFMINALLSVIPLISAADDLMQIYQVALERDPQFAAADVARDALRETVLQAKAGLLPKVNASTEINFSRQHANYENSNLISGAVQTRNISTRGLALNINQPLYQRDLALFVDQANTRVNQSEFDYQAARHSLMVRVAERYFDILAAQDSLETARAEKRALERQLEQSKQRFNVGVAAITDVHETQAGYDLAIAQELAAENQLANTQEALREIIGDYPKSLATLSETTPLLSPDPNDVERWTEFALQSNPSLESMRLRTATLKKQIEIQQAGHYPQVNAVGSLQMQNTTGSNNLMGATNTDSFAVGLQLAVPIYQGGLVSARIRQSQADYRQSLDVLEQTQRAIILAVRKAYLGVITGISRVKALNQAVISNQSALQATEAGYQVGTRTIVDVLNTQRLLFAAKRDYSQARYEYVVNSLRLKQSAGRIEEADLQNVNGSLNKKNKP